MAAATSAPVPGGSFDNAKAANTTGRTPCMMRPICGGVADASDSRREHGGPADSGASN
jgi:hypothetical protein